MECPHCEQEMTLAPNNAYRNAEVYGGSNVVLTTCCAKFVSVSTTVIFKTNKVYGSERTEDDWGNELSDIKEQLCEKTKLKIKKLEDEIAELKRSSGCGGTR